MLGCGLVVLGELVCGLVVLEELGCGLVVCGKLALAEEPIMSAFSSFISSFNATSNDFAICSIIPIIL
jgi:hypothetical protein